MLWLSDPQIKTRPTKRIIVYFSLNLVINHFKMKKQLFKILAKINKLILPSFTKKELDISKASKLQLAIIGWRAFVTMHSLN
jgi:hypothetical protein